MKIGIPNRNREYTPISGNKAHVKIPQNGEKPTAATILVILPLVSFVIRLRINHRPTATTASSTSKPRNACVREFSNLKHSLN